MIERYTREKMGAVWSQQRKMETWLEVELAATDAWAAEGVVPEEAAKKIREKASFTVEAVAEREETTGHDVAAFVDVVAESVGGEEGRWVHYGLTSSDVLDTALALQIQDSGEIIVDDLRAVRNAVSIGVAIKCQGGWGDNQSAIPQSHHRARHDLVIHKNRGLVIDPVSIEIFE